MRLHRLVPVLVLAAVVLGTPRTAHAITVEKVVAVVGEKAILLSDLRKRARPFLAQVRGTLPEGPRRAAEESKMLSQLLERMVDEQLEADASVRTNTNVSSEDVDNALRNMAGMARVTVPQLLEDVRQNTGMTEQEYRQEIRRQVLEGKLVSRLVQDRFRITEQDVERMFERVLRQERGARQYNPAWIVLRVGEGAGPAVEAEKRALGQDLVARARAGADFAALAQQYSDDGDTRGKGGDLGIRAPSTSPAGMAGKRPVLSPKLEPVVLELEPGQVSDPVPYKDAIVIIKLTSRQPSRYTTLEAAQREMVQRVKAEQLEQAKAKWLKDLRRRTHWEIRR
jgi:peptidyl-prolyl cis-trans isomerase SurA